MKCNEEVIIVRIHIIYIVFAQSDIYETHLTGQEATRPKMMTLVSEVGPDTEVGKYFDIWAISSAILFPNCDRGGI